MLNVAVVVVAVWKDIEYILMLNEQNVVELDQMFDHNHGRQKQE
jgi:hypothetical protein